MKKSQADMHPQYWTPGIAGWRIPNGRRRYRTGNHAFSSSCLYSGSAVSPSRNVAVPIFLQSSEGTAIVIFFKPSHQNRSHPVIWNCFLFRTSHLLMPASSSVMPWGIGEYWGMGINYLGYEEKWTVNYVLLFSGRT